MRDPFYCKHCGTDFWIEIPDRLTGDAFIECPNPMCGWTHSRQFESGVAVSCEMPRGPYITIRKIDP